jgi:hypothetical protein
MGQAVPVEVQPQRLCRIRSERGAGEMGWRLEPEGDARQGIRATGAPSQIRDGATVTVMLRFTDDPRFMDAAR